MPRKRIEPAGSGGNIVKLSGGSDRAVPVICRMIKRYRELRGLGQKELGRRVGVQGNAVTNWESGRSRPDINLLEPICKALDITLYELFDSPDPMLRHTPREQMLLADYRDLSEEHRYVVDRLVASLKQIESVRECPEITELTFFSRPLAAGTGDPSELDDQGEPIYLYSSRLTDRADCVFTVNGRSMEPQFHSGDMVMVQRYPGCPKPKPGEIGAFIVGNETFVKEYRTDGLYSLNPAFKPMHFSDDENVYFIGRVIGILDPEDIADQEDVELYLSVRG